MWNSMEFIRIPRIGIQLTLLVGGALPTVAGPRAISQEAQVLALLCGASAADAVSAWRLFEAPTNADRIPASSVGNPYECFRGILGTPQDLLGLPRTS